MTSHERGRSYGTGTSDETPRWMRPSQLKTSVADVSSHMDDILSPDSEVSEVFFPDDEQGLSTFSKSNSDVSADSIIRRVEEEIAAARRAAADAKSRLGPDVQQTMAVNTVMENQSKDEDDDMQAILNKESVLSKHPLPDRDVAEEFEEEFNGVHKDDQISLFSQTDDRSSFDFFADEFKHCSEEVDEIKMEEQTQCNSSGVPSKAKKHFEDKDLSTRISSPATTVETIPASNNIGPTNSWEHLETHGAGRNPRKLSNVSLRALGGVETNDADEEEASVHGNSSIGTSIGGSRNAQRARAILDTLKERRETFKSAFLTSNTISRSSTPLPPDKEGSTPPQDILSDEKKEDESNTAPWNRPVIEDLPPPTKKKVKKKKTEPKPNLEAKAEAKVKEVEETLNRKSRRIRFRDTFPVLKPTNRPRVAEDIIADHTLGQPNFPIRWVRPKSNLRQLIVAAMGNSLQRRSNACGALKVLTRQKKNQLTLARTDSFLEALLFAASQDIPTHGDKELALNARTRAIACLRNVCQPKDNRVHILVHAGNMECLLRVIKEDHGEPRVLACMALALLAKTPECRETMANTEGLVDLLSLVLRGVSDTREVKSHDSIEYLRGDSDKDFSSRSESESSERSSIRQGDSHTEASDENSISSDNSTLSETSSHCENLDVGESKRKQNQRYMKRSNLSQRKRHALINADLEPKARSNACAVLVHLSKHCAVSVSWRCNAAGYFLTSNISSVYFSHLITESALLERNTC